MPKPAYRAIRRYPASLLGLYFLLFCLPAFSLDDEQLRDIQRVAGNAADGGLTDTDLVCRTGDVCRIRVTGLPLRVLPRPNSHIYNIQQASPGEIRDENVKAFWPLYVFERSSIDWSNPAEPVGWYRVGGNPQQSQGWMQAKDVMEWRQALIVSYTHPGAGSDKREPVLMFKREDTLWDLIDADDRESAVERLYAQVYDGASPEPIISIEPKHFTDIKQHLYILPVLDFREIDEFDDPARLLQIAAAIPRQRADEQNRTVLDNPDYLKEARSDVKMDADTARDLNVDIVFVIDLTNSMQPYIDQTRDLVETIIEKAENNSGSEANIRFGLVGYRDDVRTMPQLEFTARNFTPSLLPAGEMISMIVRDVREAAATSEDYAEEVYAGVKLALDDTRWRDGLHIMILIGDASAHENDHPQSTTGMTAAELRTLADERDIYIFAVHLREDYALTDHPIAEVQFGKLAQNRGADNAFPNFPVDVSRPEDYTIPIMAINSAIADLVLRANSGQVIDPQTMADSSALSPTAQDLLGTRANSPQAEETAAAVNKVLAAALVDYLGGEPVRDITFWALDRDWLDPGKQALDVHLLVTRRELNDLLLALEQITEAVTMTMLSEMQFFEALQLIMAEAAKGQAIDLNNAQRLADSGLIPRWIESLPYKSTILDMSDALYESLGTHEREQLERDLRAKIQLYKEINENTDAWVALDPRDTDPKNWVYPLPLANLP